MKTIETAEITEETIYEYSCPCCNGFSDTYENPKIGEVLQCEHCGENLKVV